MSSGRSSRPWAPPPRPPHRNSSGYTLYPYTGLAQRLSASYPQRSLWAVPLSNTSAAPQYNTIVSATQTQSTDSLALEHLDHPAAPARAFTFRSITVGTLAVIAICSIATFNDHVVVNSFLIGSYLPLALVLLLFGLVIVVNGVLHALAPRRAISSPELSVILLMALLGCSIPCQGLFRFFLPMILGPFNFGNTNAKFWSTFQQMDLPDWLFPVPIATGRNSPVINQFIGRVQPGDPIPYSAWIAPLTGWGVFCIAWLLSLLSLMWIFRRQWSVNERLPFPIAQIETALIAPPRPGRWLNDLLASRLFWTAVVLVFLLQSSVALNKYFPKHVPLIPLKYDITRIMADDPWRHFVWYIKTSTIYFTFIGIAYFIQTRVSFSLWASFLIAQIITVNQRVYQSDISGDAWRDQHLGATIAFVAGFLWIGRHHLAAVTRQVLGRPGNTTLTNTENYRIPAMLFLLGLLGMAAWLLVLQVQWWVMLGILAMVVLSHLVTARVVAETGLPFVRSDLTAYQMYVSLPPKWFTPRDIFFSAYMYVLGPVSTRESPAVMGQQGMVVADHSGADTGRSAMKFAAVIIWTLLLAYVVSSASLLWTHYTYATPISLRVKDAMLDPPAMDRPRTEMIDPVVQQVNGQFSARSYSPAAHMSAGLVVCTILQTLSLRSASWPLLPVGYLLCNTWYIGLAWFSLMLGWLAKVLILRFGGATMYQKARPFFVGAIFGEALAAGVWMLVSLILALSGADYQSVPMLPQ